MRMRSRDTRILPRIGSKPSESHFQDWEILSGQGATASSRKLENACFGSRMGEQTLSVRLYRESQRSRFPQAPQYARLSCRRTTYGRVSGRAMAAIVQPSMATLASRLRRSVRIPHVGGRGRGTHVHGNEYGKTATCRKNHATWLWGPCTRKHIGARANSEAYVDGTLCAFRQAMASIHCLFLYDSAKAARPAHHGHYNRSEFPLAVQGL